MEGWEGAAEGQRAIRGGALLRKSALQQYPVAVVQQYAAGLQWEKTAEQQQQRRQSLLLGDGERGHRKSAGSRAGAGLVDGVRGQVSEAGGCRYLVQVRHEVLVERADQHVQRPLSLLGKRRCLQCGFLSIDYCQTNQQEEGDVSKEQHTGKHSALLVFLC